MPFPLSHPAAVLPLRRWCPRTLSFSALVLGSLVPDLGYLFYVLPFPRIPWSALAHSLPGSILFCLPVGWLVYLGFQWIREPLAATLPDPHRRLILPLARRSGTPWWGVALSLWIGSLTHILLDAVTNESYGLIRDWVRDHEELLVLQQNGLRPHRVLWLLLSAGGIGWLAATYLRFLRRSANGRLRLIDWSHPGPALWWTTIFVLPALIVPLGALNRIMSRSGPQALYYIVYAVTPAYLVAVALLIIATGVVARLRAIKAPKRCAPGCST